MPAKPPSSARDTQLFRDFLTLIEHGLEQKGMSRKEFARLLGTTLAGVSQTVNGPSGISFERAEKWGKVVGMRLRIVAERVPAPRKELPPR